MWFFFGSCAFDMYFLAPEKIPIIAQKGKYVSPTGDTVFINISHPTFQPTFFDRNNKEIQKKYRIESIVFRSQSGNNLNGWFIRPNDSNSAVTLLFFHGNSGNVLTEYLAMIPLVERGFQIFIFDYSGYGFSEGKASRENIKKDAFSALEFVRSHEDVNKLIIYGQSLGGNLAAVIANERQNDVDAVVIEGTFSSYKNIAAYTTKIGLIARLIVAEKDNALDAVKSYHKPILIIHSTDDQTIPFSMSEELFENANEPKYFYKIKGCHMCGTVYYPDSIKNKILQMIQ